MSAKAYSALSLNCFLECKLHIARYIKAPILAPPTPERCLRWCRNKGSDIGARVVCVTALNIWRRLAPDEMQHICYDLRPFFFFFVVFTSLAEIEDDYGDPPTGESASENYLLLASSGRYWHINLYDTFRPDMARTSGARGFQQ